MVRYEVNWNQIFIVLAFICCIPQQVSSVFTFKQTFDQLEIFLDNRLILQHSEAAPTVFVGFGEARYKTHHGNFDVSETILQRLELSKCVVQDKLTSVDANSSENSLQVTFFAKHGTSEVTLRFSSESDQSVISVVDVSGGDFNRLWIRLWSNKEEHLYGGGEQFSHFSLRGYTYPMWVREQGVGRNKSTLVTYLADLLEGAGGDYYTSYWLQHTFLSDRIYYAHVDYYHYSLLNLTQDDYHEMEFWDEIKNLKIYFKTALKWATLLEKLTKYFGRQPPPPSWIYDGAILGLQGGTEDVLRKCNKLEMEDVKISAIWIQDWSGKIYTSLGKRVYWNWRWDPKMYPNLDNEIKNFKTRGVRFLAYINPHIIKDSPMYKEANENGFFIKSASTEETLLIDFGEFDCGTVDLTNPQAYEWYKQVLKDMLEFGFSGWMADFGGEYLPTANAKYYNGKSANEMHNFYNELWAKLNKDAVVETGKLNETLIFMRSGFGQSPGHVLASWAGDQNVDFSYADGLASVIPAALSIGMSGMGISHSDVGGYLSAFCVVRTEELILRWAEMNVFTPILRTHEGNKPDRNWQVYTTKKTAQSFSRISRLYSLLAPYHQNVAEENAKYGYPAQRPLFFHYPDDPNTLDIQFQYMYGPDLLVAPVFLEARRWWNVYLPPDDWIYLWNGSQISVESNKGEGRMVSVEALLGNTPVFYRKGTKWTSLFQQLAAYKVYREDDSIVMTWELFWENPMIFFYLILRKLFWYIFFNV